MHFRLITYNIHKGIGGVDRLYRPERIVEALVHYRPDIVLLQEVDDGVPRSRRHRQAELLSAALELPHLSFQANVKLRSGTYGNALLSRFPVEEIDDIELTIPLKKRRRAQFARLRLRDNTGHSHSLVVVNFHLGLAAYERKLQIRRILESDSLRRTHHHTATIAAGDMNDVWGGLGRQLLEPVGFQSAAGPVKTFPAFLPLRPLDRIYYRGGLKLRNSFASRTAVARRASDHLPLVAEFELTIPDYSRV